MKCRLSREKKDAPSVGSISGLYLDEKGMCVREKMLTAHVNYKQIDIISLFAGTIFSLL